MTEKVVGKSGGGGREQPKARSCGKCETPGAAIRKNSASSILRAVRKGKPRGSWREMEEGDPSAFESGIEVRRRREDVCSRGAFTDCGGQGVAT